MARTNKHIKDRKREFTCPGCRQTFARKAGLKRHLQRFMPTPEDLAARFTCFVDECDFDPQVQKVNRDKHVQYQHPDVWFERTGLIPVKKPRKVHKSREDTCSESPESTQEEEEQQTALEQPLVLPEVPSIPSSSYSTAEPQTSFVFPENAAAELQTSLVYTDDIFVPAAPHQSQPYFWSQIPHMPFPVRHFRPFPLDQFQSSPYAPVPVPPPSQPSPWIPTPQLHQPIPVYPPQSFTYFLSPQSQNSTSIPGSSYGNVGLHDYHDQYPQL